MNQAQGSMAGKVALVTGSSRGIGRAIATAFARERASVVVTYHRQKAPAEEVVRSIQSSGGESLLAQLDVSDRSSIAGLLDRVEAWRGKLHVLVNNAGLLEQKPFSEITDQDWDVTLGINLKGVFLCSQQVISRFQDRGLSTILNITSVGGQTGGTQAVHYAAAKAGVISLTKSMAQICSPAGIRVNAIAPGFIQTDMYQDIILRQDPRKIREKILLGRTGEPEEVAEAALFLAGDESGYITGHVLNVNGGLYLGSGS